MAKQVTIYLFDVDWSNKTQTLSDTLNEFGGISLDQRWRSEIRLDHIELSPADSTGKLPERYHLNFTKRRDIGPGKLGDAMPISSIQLEHDEDFGEETAALYVPSKKMLLVLHNQNGIGATRMMSYLNALDPGSSRYFDYIATVQLDATAAGKLNDMDQLKSIDVTVKVDALQTSGDNVSMSLSQATKEAGAQKISLRMQAKGTRKLPKFLDLKMASEFIKSLQQRSDDVSVLRVKGRESNNDDSSDQVIDLLKHKVKVSYRTTELEVVNHRYTEKSKRLLLDKALRQWI